MFWSGILSAFLAYFPTYVLINAGFNDDSAIGVWVVYFAVAGLLCATILLVGQGIILKRYKQNPYYIRRLLLLIPFASIMLAIIYASSVTGHDFPLTTPVIGAVFIVLYAVITTILTRVPADKALLVSLIIVALASGAYYVLHNQQKQNSVQTSSRSINFALVKTGAAQKESFEYGYITNQPTRYTFEMMVYGETAADDVTVNAMETAYSSQQQVLKDDGTCVSNGLSDNLVPSTADNPVATCVNKAVINGHTLWVHSGCQNNQPGTSYGYIIWQETLVYMEWDCRQVADDDLVVKVLPIYFNNAEVLSGKSLENYLSKQY